jgi:HEAT repeat protein
MALFDVRAAERGRFGWFAALAALLAFAQMLGQAGTEAIFLARLGPARLPLAFVLASMATVTASLGYALRVGRARNDRVACELALLFAAAVAAGAVALRQGSPHAVLVLYCLWFAAQAVLTGHFWTLVGDYFDTLAAKRVVPLFTVGLSFGGALGGGAALGVVSALPADTLLVGWGAGLAAAALVVMSSRKRLTRWRALSQGEQDETSVEGLYAATRYLRASALGRSLFASALAMVLALFVAQFLYSQQIAAAFPDERELARFLAVYLMASNVVEMAIEVGVTPLAIRKLGVPTANLIQPLTTLASFAALVFAPSLASAVAARANRELLDNALAIPVRTLAANALPERFRARVRAFLEGIVVYGGMSLAGGVLLVAQGLSATALAATGAALAGVHLLANLGVRRQYLASIVAELRAGRFDWHELVGEIGRHEVESLAELWSHLVRTEGAEPSSTLLDLPPLLVARGLAATVREALPYAGPTLRAACLEALGAHDADPALWFGALVDPDPSVRRVALRALPVEAATNRTVQDVLRALTTDADPRVRAGAAARLGAEGEAVLASLLGSGHADAVVATLAVLPPALVPLAIEATGAAEARVRTAALDAMARVGDVRALEASRLDAALADADAHVRRAAVGALATLGERPALERIARALRDPAREVRSAAVAALAEAGDIGAVLTRPLLDAPEESAVRGALRAIGEIGTPAARDFVRAEYGRRVREAIEAFLCARVLSASGASVPSFAVIASGDALARALRIAWRALARIEDERVVRSTEHTLRHAAGRMRADALEVLSQLGDREASRRLVVLLEPLPVEEKIAALRPFAVAPRDVATALARARELSSPWMRLAARARNKEEESQMQRLLSLRQVSLFSHMSLERLHAVERILRDAEYVSGEVIMREEEPGDDLFLLVEGQVDVLRSAGTPAEIQLNRLGAGAYFGEMAVLDGGPRSATIVAASPVRALVLQGERLRELVNEMPELAFDLLRVLAGRLRKLEERMVDAGAGVGD